jgi:predicted RNA binding protein YcfA (HicA-like mRNA interferase family)
MKLPRGVSGHDVVKGLRRVGYEVTRQRGHVYMTTQQDGEHHVAIPMHNPIKDGTLATSLSSVGAHLGIDRAELRHRMKL